MARCTVTMRHDHLDHLLCSTIKALCNALLCPDVTYADDLKHPVL